MKYTEFIPGDALKQYVKCYYLYETDTKAVFEDKAFATGCIEFMFNLGTSRWQTNSGDGFHTTPLIELWGQVIRPLAVRSTGRNTMLGVRFYPHAAAAILNDRINLFNHQVANFGDVMGNGVHSLHSQLMDARSWTKRLALIETYLLQQLSLATKRLNKIAVVSDLMLKLQQQESFDTMETVATRYGISARYMQQLFVQYTGLTPKFYSQINRFQNSLQLVKEGNSSLTSIAYECGYADQSHFIREFKTFTGLTPSGYAIANSPVDLAASLAEQQHEAALIA